MSNQTMKTAGSSSGNLFLTLAWRNLWRNRRRTLISIASVFFAVWLSVVMSSMQIGQHEMMIETAVEMYTGHVQIQGKDYWEKRSLDNGMIFPPEEMTEIKKISNVTIVTPRLESFALLSHGVVTKVCPVTGIDPVLENAMTGLKQKLIAGQYLTNDSPGALLAEGLAARIKADVGDSVMFYGQGFQGMTAAAVVRVEGIVKFPIPDLNNSMTYMALPAAQNLFAAPGRFTSLALILKDGSKSDETAAILRQKYSKEYDVMTWREMMPELVQVIAVDRGGSIIMLLMLYLVIGFGIFGTVMMMTAERMKEFGIMISVGLKRWKLITVTTIEAVIIALLGAASGAAAAIPVLLYYYFNPIMLTGDYGKAMLGYGLEPILPISLNPIIFIDQGLVVIGMGMLSALYPLKVIWTLKPVSAMHQ